MFCSGSTTYLLPRILRRAWHQSLWIQWCSPGQVQRIIVFFYYAPAYYSLNRWLFMDCCYPKQDDDNLIVRINIMIKWLYLQTDYLKKVVLRLFQWTLIWAARVIIICKYRYRWESLLGNRCVVDNNRSDTFGYLQLPGPVVCGAAYSCGEVCDPVHLLLTFC